MTLLTCETVVDDTGIEPVTPTVSKKVGSRSERMTAQRGSAAVRGLERSRAVAAALSIAVAAHPGISNTELARNSPAVFRGALTWLSPVVTQSAAAGALSTLRAATDPSVLGGQYYGPDGLSGARGYPRLVTCSPDSYDMAVQQRLCAVSEDLTGVRFPVGRAAAAA
jgi:hypothetical protein